jgi:hypothetical protein
MSETYNIGDRPVAGVVSLKKTGSLKIGDDVITIFEKVEGGAEQTNVFLSRSDGHDNDVSMFRRSGSGSVVHGAD